MIVITAYMKAKEGSGDDLEKAIKNYAPKFLKDPGCVAYQVHRRVDIPNNFFFYEKYEKYENDEALKFHSSAPHFKEMFIAMKPFLEGKAEIAMYKEI
jgi:quinol monooxygenase YgiN